ncbi:hypothetical protein K7X08_025143 [Anisodus acutangulus]|uniref:Uncharacterized protein n=1 Tax=Anisodus acutangulus TaxID=402998 RepID=A0A9Q1RFQ0_9SOLA|nr:hypothetical protein K7X08_025143 [Anisodus acutangulus]
MSDSSNPDPDVSPTVPTLVDEKTLVEHVQEQIEQDDVDNEQAQIPDQVDIEPDQPVHANEQENVDPVQMDEALDEFCLIPFRM